MCTEWHEALPCHLPVTGRTMHRGPGVELEKPFVDEKARRPLTAPRSATCAAETPRQTLPRGGSCVADFSTKASPDFADPSVVGTVAWDISIRPSLFLPFIQCQTFVSQSDGSSSFSGLFLVLPPPATTPCPGIFPKNSCFVNPISVSAPWRTRHRFLQGSL